MQQHDLQKNTGSTRARRVGRGGKRGKTSGKGHKGQKSRAGRKLRPQLRDTLKRIPKLRGHGQNRSRTVNTGKVSPEVVNLKELERVCSVGDRVDPAFLVAHGVVSRISGRLPAVKVLGMGTLSKKITVVRCEVSAAARAAVEKAGGEVL